MIYRFEDLTGISTKKPQFLRPKAVRGHRLTFRDATPADADFILALRLDPAKNTFLSPTPADPERQREWLTAYASDATQIYFIIEHGGRPVGTVRLYDQRGSSFCWGSWILSDGTLKSAAVESMLMVYAVALSLGFTASHFDVRKGNRKVWRYHERFGAKRVAENDQDYLYTIDKGSILQAIKRYRGYECIAVEF